MLREIHIKNFSIIDNVHIEFGEGFNVLTGETGAGKSIIIGALSLALGERAAADLIRSRAIELASGSCAWASDTVTSGSNLLVSGHCICAPAAIARSKTFSARDRTLPFDKEPSSARSTPMHDNIRGAEYYAGEEVEC